MIQKKTIVVGASGASGFPILKKCLEFIREAPEYESALIVSRNGLLTIRHETGEDPKAYTELADRVYAPEDIAAGPASGTWKSCGMLIVPCSMKTLAGVHAGLSDNLLLRAADVAMKENRPLVLAARETPLSAVHLRNMYELSLIPSVRIIPPMMSFYHHPRSIEEMTAHIAAKLLEPFGIDAEGYRRWEDPQD